MMDRRNSNRFKTDQSIVCTFFSSYSPCSSFDGKMKNFSDNGMYAELQTSLKKGSVLLVRTTRGPNDASHHEAEDGIRSISIVEVKWSKHLRTNGVFCYGVGLKHLAV